MHPPECGYSRAWDKLGVSPLSSGYQVLPSCQGLRDQPGARSSRAACQAGPHLSAAQRARALPTSHVLPNSAEAEGKSRLFSPSLSRQWAAAEPTLILKAKQEKRSCTEPRAGSQTPAQGTSEEEGPGLNFHSKMLGSQNVSCSWTTQGLGQERGHPFSRNASERVGDVEGCPRQKM